MPSTAADLIDDQLRAFFLGPVSSMEDVFSLRGIDVFRVLDASEVPSRGTAAST